MTAGRRVLVVVVLVALGAALVWALVARPWRQDTPESRLHDAAEGLKDRIRELTH